MKVFCVARHRYGIFSDNARGAGAIGAYMSHVELHGMVVMANNMAQFGGESRDVIHSAWR